MIDTPEVYEVEERKEIIAKIEKRKPWSDYKVHLQRGNITFYEIQERILDAAKIDFKMASVVALLYLTASRVNEILHYTYRGIYASKLPKIEKDGIRIKDIEEKEEDDGTWVYFTTRNEKQSTHRGQIGVHLRGVSIEERYKTLIRNDTKTVKLLFDEMCPDYTLLALIKNYIISQNTLREMDEEDEIYYDVNYGRLQSFIKRFIKVTPHVLRHIRMLHLRKVYGLDIAELKTYGGWASAEMPLKYSKADAQQIGQRFMEHLSQIREKWSKFQNVN